MIVIAAIAGLIWVYLLLGRGAFWLGTERDDTPVAEPAAWPRIAVVIPARDEADCIAATLTSLMRQDYPGECSVILVDDNSGDGTAAVARASVAAIGAAERLHVIAGAPLPPGWTGKLWALKQGIDAAGSCSPKPDYLLLTDADIVYAPDALRRLVARACTGGLVLTSLMAKLRCESVAERSHVPAFIFFFQMLYPFSWVNRPGGRTAAAAGGCMLLRADAFAAAGHVDAIRNALIDDCALAAVMKAQGPIWLGLTERVVSIRRYETLSDIGRMISRSAYAQLRYSPVLLLGTIAGMMLTYLAPPLLALFGSGIARALGAATWLMMALAFQPTLRFYRASPLWGLALPAIALSYMAFTIESALQHMRGRGGQWKGRIQAMRT